MTAVSLAVRATGEEEEEEEEEATATGATLGTEAEPTAFFCSEEEEEAVAKADLAEAAAAFSTAEDTALAADWIAALTTGAAAEEEAAAAAAATATVDAALSSTAAAIEIGSPADAFFIADAAASLPLASRPSNPGSLPPDVTWKAALDTRPDQARPAATDWTTAATASGSTAAPVAD
jgi:hypothetical protein